VADFCAAALANMQIKADDMNSDLHASAQYCAHLCGVMARRAVIKMTG
jgi:carbon-monoxide dehydrogenase medium subunit